MKKMSWKLNMIVLSLLLVIVLFPQTVHSAQKKQSGSKGNISYSVKNGTLIVSGTGAVPSGMKFKNSKNIKKVIVKKGITSLSVYAFDSLKQVEEIEIADTVRKIGENALPVSRNLKKITMPGTFQYLPDEDSDYRSNSIIADKRAQIDTIVFNTSLSLKTLSYVKGRNLIVSKKDKKYKSIKGVIYSKDGKSLVRVPGYRESLTVEEGCEEFCIQAVEYATSFWIVDDDSEEELICQELKKIVLPASIRSVNTKKYKAEYDEISRVKEIEVKSKQLADKDILLLLEEFPKLEENRFWEQFDYISHQDGMYINTKDASLIIYEGNAEELSISDQIRKIEAKAFSYSDLKRVVIPDSVTQIGEGVFRSCTKLQEVRLPETMTKIPKKMFYKCTSLKEVTLPDNVTIIGEDAFGETKVQPSILLQGKIEEIQSGAFEGVDWKTFELPETVKKVQGSAFSMAALKRVTICGDTSQISPWAFSRQGESEPTLIFLKGIEHWQTNVELDYWGDEDLLFHWQKVAGVDGWQIQVSKDKAFRKKKTYYVKKGTTKMKTADRTWKIYVRIRPWKTVDGKRCYGKWVTDGTNNYKFIT